MLTNVHYFMNVMSLGTRVTAWQTLSNRLRTIEDFQWSIHMQQGNKCQVFPSLITKHNTMLTKITRTCRLSCKRYGHYYNSKYFIQKIMCIQASFSKHDSYLWGYYKRYENTHNLPFSTGMYLGCQKIQYIKWDQRLPLEMLELELCNL